MRASGAAVIHGSKIKIDLTEGGGVGSLPPEQRDEMLKALDRAPWGMAPLLRSAAMDPRGLRARFLDRLPRVLFVLVPVFAGIVALFYRRRRFPQHLVFALHLHAAFFRRWPFGRW